MCARFTLKASAQAIRDLFEVDDIPEWEPRFNIAPTDPVMVCAMDREGHRRARLARWGLVPSWDKDLASGVKRINARSETVAEKPSFRDAFLRRRCLVAADGFYEWTDPWVPAKRAPRQPYRITGKDGQPFCFAGLYETWKPEQGDPILTCTILTTGPNDVVRPLHDRMPVILRQEDQSRWLDRDTEPEQLQLLLRPYPSELTFAYPVSTLVNRVGYDEPDALDPVSAPAAAGAQAEQDAGSPEQDSGFEGLFAE